MYLRITENIGLIILQILPPRSAKPSKPVKLAKENLKLSNPKRLLPPENIDTKEFFRSFFN